MQTRLTWIAGVAAAACVLALVMDQARAGDEVTPSYVTITNFRGEAVGTISGTYYQDSTLRLTNCVLYAGTSTNAAKQGLDGVTVTVSVGTAATNVDYAATVLSTNLGTYACDVVVPSFVTAPYLQVKITDANTNIYVYPWKGLQTLTGM